MDKDRTYLSMTTALPTGCGEMFLTLVKLKDGRVVKIIPNLGKAGTCARALLESFAEVLSKLILLSSKKDITSTLALAIGHSCQYNNLCCVDVMTRYILEYHLNLNQDDDLETGGDIDDDE